MKYEVVKLIIKNIITRYINILIIRNQKNSLTNKIKPRVTLKRYVRFTPIQYLTTK